MSPHLDVNLIARYWMDPELPTFEVCVRSV